MYNTESMYQNHFAKDYAMFAKVSKSQYTYAWTVYKEKEKMFIFVTLVSTVPVSILIFVKNVTLI